MNDNFNGFKDDDNNGFSPNQDRNEDNSTPAPEEEKNADAGEAATPGREQPAQPESAPEASAAAPTGQQAPQSAPTGWQNGATQQGYYQSPQNPYPPMGGYGYQGGHMPMGSSYQQNPQPPRQEYKWSSVNMGQPAAPNGQPQKPKKNKGLIVFSVILVIALIGVITTFVIYAFLNADPYQTGSQSGNTVSGPSLEINSRPADNEDQMPDGKLTDTAIAKKVKPSVVGIVVYVKTGSFGQYQMYGQGSGIIMSEDGYIVSNAHVFTTKQGDLVDSIQVYLDNGDSYGATMVGIDTRSDLAVIKIKAKNLTKATFGDSTTVEVGEHVLAIGNPSGMELAGSVTGGMVSAVNRNIRSSNGFSMTCIQTDAAINPGNSGGALVNAYGQVIGINSSKIAEEGYEGIGFAIAISEAKPIIDSLVNNGYVEGRVKIGLTYQEIDKFTAALNDCPQGLQVVGIDSSLPVGQSGLQVGDIITKMDDQETLTTEQVNAVLKEKKPGDVVKMTVYRITDVGEGQTLTIDVTLTEDKGNTLTGGQIN